MREKVADGKEGGEVKKDRKERAERKERKEVQRTTAGEPMIIVNINDRLGTKAAIPCLASDPISQSTLHTYILSLTAEKKEPRTNSSNRIIQSSSSGEDRSTTA